MRPPLLVQRLFFSLVWKMPSKEKVLYLTFDDGPIPEVTPWVLEQLDHFGAKATFFCIGNNVRKHRNVYQRILQSGHSVGNHTYHHLNGWSTFNSDYFKDIELCNRLVGSELFRPPYGKIRPTQIARLKYAYRIIMWDVLSRDYDRNLTGETVLNTVLENSRPGSIIVFHDSLKAEERLRYALPKVLEHFSAKGYRFVSL
jgi:peptidoglycan/xylan/chitin deacetylase (PgdA/CDA1 family)